MSIQKDDPHLYGVLNSMLQGLCYWMGYRMECYAGHSILEGAAVDIAVGLINNHIDHHTYVVKMEYPYRKLGVSNSKERADIVILKKESKKENNLIPVCVMEFKRADDTNGGIWADIEKLDQIKLYPNTIQPFRLAILLSRKKISLVEDFIDNVGDIDEKARRVVNSKRNKRCVSVRVILSKKAMKAYLSKSPFRATCIELS